MNRNYFPEFMRGEGEVIAGFGRAKLIKTLDCKYELHGGSTEDLAAAKEWISMFMHEVVIREMKAQSARPGAKVRSSGVDA